MLLLPIAGRSGKSSSPTATATGAPELPKVIITSDAAEPAVVEDVPNAGFDDGQRLLGGVHLAGPNHHRRRLTVNLDCFPDSTVLEQKPTKSSSSTSLSSFAGDRYGSTGALSCQSSLTTNPSLLSASHIPGTRQLSSKEKEPPSSKLLDDYVLGDMLGEGSFSTVYACCAIASQNEYAVKMVDKVESPLEAIKQEIDLLAYLKHPNIVRFIEVFWEKYFVCIVLDCHRGGDLLVGMQRMWGSPDGVVIQSLIHIKRQILKAVQFLHQQCVVHRDVKGDNYLLDRHDIVDRECIVTLTDFGTACRWDGHERLREPVGTRTYWSPEFFSMDYGSKVDDWAVGVVICGLVTGAFPFDSDVAIQDPDRPALFATDVPPLCLELVQQLLEKDEAKRMTSAQAVEHPWIEIEVPPEDTRPSSPSDKPYRSESALLSPPAIYASCSMVRLGTGVQSCPVGSFRRPDSHALTREQGPDSHVHERRKELFDRLELQAASRRRSCRGLSGVWEHRASQYDKRASSLAVSDESLPLHSSMCRLASKRFEVMDRNSKHQIGFEWRSREEAEALLGLNSSGMKGSIVSGSSDGDSTERPTSRASMKDSLHSIRVQLIEEARETCEGCRGLLAGCSAGSDDEHATADAHRLVVAQMLADHGIDASVFGVGQARTLEQFANEMRTGAAQLMLDATEHRTLVRVVNVVLLRICLEIDGKPVRYLVDCGEMLPGGETRKHSRLPGSKKEPYENTRQVVERVTREVLNMADCKVSFSFDGTEVFEDVAEESQSYPGVKTVYRKEIVEGFVTTSKTQVLKRVGCGICGKGEWTHADKYGIAKVFQWLTEEECQERDTQIYAPEDAEEISCLVPAPVGLSEEKLRSFLSSAGVDTKTFGVMEGSKTLKELAEESRCGETSFRQAPDGTVLRVCDFVLLKLSKNDGSDILIEVDEAAPDSPETPTVLNRLPGSRLRPTDNQFVTAHSILSKKLNIDQNCVNLRPDSVEVREFVQHSTSYPGLLTLYRQHIIPGEVLFAETVPCSP